jgi:uncharacterized membrane protein YgcG
MSSSLATQRVARAGAALRASWHICAPRPGADAGAPLARAWSRAASTMTPFPTPLTTTSRCRPGALVSTVVGPFPRCGGLWIGSPFLSLRAGARAMSGTPAAASSSSSVPPPSTAGGPSSSSSSGPKAAGPGGPSSSSKGGSRLGGGSGGGGGGSGGSPQTIIRTLLHYVWPVGQPGLRLRVVVALLLLVGSKVVNIQVPFLFKHAADRLADATQGGGAGTGTGSEGAVGVGGVGGGGGARAQARAPDRRPPLQPPTPPRQTATATPPRRRLRRRRSRRPGPPLALAAAAAVAAA